MSRFARGAERREFTCVLSKAAKPAAVWEAEVERAFARDAGVCGPNDGPPSDIHLLDTRATILANLPNRLADARSDFVLLAERLPAKTREKAQAFLRLGRLCVKLDDPAQAKQYLQNALEIDRETPVFTADERLEITKIIRESGVQAGGG